MVGESRFTATLVARKFFECECPNKDHGRCTLTRTLYGTERAGQESNGRFVGFLGAWRTAGTKAVTKSDHKKHTPSVDDRMSARREMRKTASGLKLLALEPPLAVGTVVES